MSISIEQARQLAGTWPPFGADSKDEGLALYHVEGRMALGRTVAMTVCAKGQPEACFALQEIHPFASAVKATPLDRMPGVTLHAAQADHTAERTEREGFMRYPLDLHPQAFLSAWMGWQYAQRVGHDDPHLWLVRDGVRTFNTALAVAKYLDAKRWSYALSAQVDMPNFVQGGAA